MAIENNIKETALIFEGGGMRASYTAGFLNNLLENGLYFDYVAGISAGSSHSVNYLSRDTQRAKRSFVDLVLDPQFGGWHSFLMGEGFFRSKYIYEDTPYPEAALPFDMQTFMENPARLRIGAFDRDSGEMKYYTKADIRNIEDLAKIVRSSSSMPIFMPPTFYDDHYYVDGGLGGGIPLDIAKKDGLKKFFVILTRPKGYRKSPVKYQGAIKRIYRRYPLVAEAMLNRHIAYNQTLDELETLEQEGKAFLVYPQTMPVTNREVNYSKLEESYRLGYEQGKREVPEWKEYLFG
ncbi:MAG: phospholipase [Bacillota bacterium]|jgi:predicted patatin/cPLA2 family phospholipase|nr:phospholipase [Bacillota bacterium]